MKILVDECLDWRLARALTGHEAKAVTQLGWSGIKNGRLLALMREAGFEVFLTADRNLQFQQNVPAAGVAVVVLIVKTTRLADTLPLMSQLLDLIPALTPGVVKTITAPER